MQMNQELLQAGLAHLQAGRLEDACSCFEELLLVNPEDHNALHFLGLAHNGRGEPDHGIELIEQAISIYPNYPEALINLGNILLGQGELDAAVQHFEKALSIHPGFAEAHYNLGNALMGQGKLDDAIVAYERAVRIRPDYAEAHYNRGNALMVQGKLDDAITAFEGALRIRPEFAEAHNNLGYMQWIQGNLDVAIVAYEKALRVRPEFAEAHNNLANAMMGKGRFDAAVVCCEKAIRIRPNYVEAYNNLGNALVGLGNLDAAVTAYEKALGFEPNLAEVHNNLGNALIGLGKPDAAVVCCEKAISIKPDFVEAHNSLGNALTDQGKLDAAVSSYEKAITIKPGYSEARSNLLYALHYNPNIDEEQLFQAHLAWDRAHGQEFPGTLPAYQNNRDLDRALKVGYVSADLRTHPGGFFSEAVWNAHDPGKVVIYAYSAAKKEDSVTERLRACASVWRSTLGISDADLDQQIREDGIDILVDLSGHSAGNRLPVFARRPAPIQISWLGYFYTTGLTAMNAILMDPVTVPAADERWFVEKVIKLPGGRFCYAPPDYAPAVGPLPFESRGAVTFGSFNNLAKVTPEVLSIWGRILALVSDARLIIKWQSLKDPAFSERLRASFAAVGGDVTRLELRGSSPHPEMLQEYNDIDIALDPFPFSGGLTTCEALWMGVPTITFPGSRPVSRQTVSILTQLGLESELATSSEDEYIDKAVSLASSHNQLAVLRSSLRETMRQSELCDGRRFVRNLESVYRALWHDWCRSV